MLERGEKRLVLVDAWLRVAAPTEMIPMAKDSLANEEAERGADFSIRSLEARVLDFKSNGGAGACKQCCRSFCW